MFNLAAENLKHAFDRFSTISDGVEGSAKIHDLDDIKRIKPPKQVKRAIAGQTTKLVNQVISGCTMVLVAEAVSLAEASGVDASRLKDALGGGFADSKPFQLLAPRMSERAFEDPLGTVASMLKDLAVVGDVGQSVGADLPMTTTATKMLEATVENGHADSDISTLILTYRGDQPEG